MITILSLVTSVKDYFEIVHKLLEFNPNYSVSDYNEWGGFISYAIISIKNFLTEFVSLYWLQNLWSLPIIVPDIASSMISEISVLDGYFHNAFSFLETPLSYGKQNISLYGLEKFTIGLINSIFLFLPTSAAHIILLRRFVFQGIEAGYIAGIGIIAGNILWLASIIFGWRFFVIPWLSLDILRYVLGFVILIKFMWHAAHDERRTNIVTNLSKSKIFFVNFLLALTEQTSIYPFITNMSIGAESSIVETFPVENLAVFIFIHLAYLLGILAGSLSLLHLTCWLWENPIYKIYIWFISNSSFPFNIAKGTKTNYYKYLNFGFLYLTMLCTISSIPYFGLDYTLTNPLGFVSDDRILYPNNKKTTFIPETSFLSTQASDRNTRDSRGRHGRRERWKERLIKYRGMDTSLYDQGVYDLFTIEDLNYGFDKFWYRRKIKNHHSRFRMVIFQPWLLSLKKQLAKPRLISNEGVRVEFFRMLYEQFYHPNFHAYARSVSPSSKTLFKEQNVSKSLENLLPLRGSRLAFKPVSYTSKLENINRQQLNSYPRFVDGMGNPSFGRETRVKIDNKLTKEFSALRKFVRKINTRIKSSLFIPFLPVPHPSLPSEGRSGTDFYNTNKQINKPIYSKRNPLNWYPNFSKLLTNIPLSTECLESNTLGEGIKNNWQKGLYKFPNITSNINKFQQNQSDALVGNNKISQNDFKENWQKITSLKDNQAFTKQLNFLEKEKLTIIHPSEASRGLMIGNKKDRQILRYKTNLIKNKTPLEPKMFNNAKTLLHPIKFYLQKEKAFRRKFKFYGANIFRKFSIENNAPYFRIMMKRLFYYYKPTLRWTNTLKLAKNKQGHKVRKKKYRTPLRAQTDLNSAFNANTKKESAIKNNQKTNLQHISFPLLPSLPSEGTSSGTGQNNSKRNEIAALSPTLLDGEENKPIIKRPTHHFRVVGKNASRYRYQIYKDVLHHWYYTPFNRFLLKLDVDSFIRRQPNAHFLTKNEEQVLHLKRFLLSEHYETLRWYTYMQHYRSMKTKIGGTKSFASRMYNQQFQGTLKKIRHLFAITPSLFTNQLPLTNSTQTASVLKFDQPLYNEYFNNRKNSNIQTLKKNNQKLLKAPPLEASSSFLEGFFRSGGAAVIHEELLANKEKKTQHSPTGPYINNKASWINKNNTGLISSPLSVSNLQLVEKKDDLIAQSTKIVREYLKTAKFVRQETIHKLILKKNYKDLTKFMFTGQKNRGVRATTNERSLLNQEKVYLYKKTELEELTKNSLNFFKNTRLRHNKAGRFAAWSADKNIPIEHPLSIDLWFYLLKNYKKGLYDQELLSKFLERRIKKREKRQQKKEKELKNRLKRIQIWLAPNKIRTNFYKTDIDKRKNNTPSNSKFLLNPQGLESGSSSVKSLYPETNFFLRDFFQKQPLLEEKEGSGLVRPTGIKNAIKDGFLTLNFPAPTTPPGGGGRRRERGMAEKSVFNNPVKNSKKLSFIAGRSHKNFVSKRFLDKLSKRLLKASMLRKKKIALLQAAPTKTTKKAFQSGSFVRSNYLKEEVAALLPLKNVRGSAALNLFSLSSFKTKYYLLKNKIKNVLKKVNPSPSGIRKGGALKNTLKFLKPISKKEPRWWDQKDKMLKKRKRSRKKYTKEIKKAQNSYLSSLKEQKNELRPLHQFPPSTPHLLFFRSSQKESKGKALELPDNVFTISNNIYKKKNLKLKSEALNTKENLNSGSFPYGEEVAASKSSQKTKFFLLQAKLLEAFKRKKISDNGGKKAPLQSFPFSKSKNAATSVPEGAFFPVGEELHLYLKTIYAGKLNAKKVKRKQSNSFLEKFISINAAYRRKKTKNRRHQRFGRPHHRIEHPSYNANIERKSANMIPEKRLQILKDVYNQSILQTPLSSLNAPYPKTSPSGPTFNPRFPKKRKSKKRNWKKYKKGINTEKLRKARKQNRDAVGKIRALTKQIKRIKLNLKLQQWWWQKFIPNLQATTEANWQLEKERQLKKKITQMSKTEILERDFLNNNKNEHIKKDLQIGDYDFKPLAIPQALRIRDDLIKKNLLNFANPLLLETDSFTNNKLVDNTKTSMLLNKEAAYKEPLTKKNHPLLEGLEKKKVEVSAFGEYKKFLINTNPLPFYAGWDESLRKFVVTNRLLSRREAGYSSNILSTLLNSSTKINHTQPMPWQGAQSIKQTNPTIEFTNAPLQGMNAGTTLYCQVPFTTFDPDQLFSKGMDGFAPIGWRRFSFTHTIFKSKQQRCLKKWINLLISKEKNQNGVYSSNTTSIKEPFLLDRNQKENSLKPLLIKNIIKQHQIICAAPYLGYQKFKASPLIYKLTNRAKTITFNKPYCQQLGIRSCSNFETLKKNNNYSRLSSYAASRLKKHYKRIKKLQNEKVPVFLMSGPLINEVLPIHYINVFNKQNRLSKDRYIKRRLRRSKKGVPKAIKEFNSKNSQQSLKLGLDSKGIFDFTLRRRIKTRRKYHRKPYYAKGIEVRPRRHKFFAHFNTNFYLTKNTEKSLYPKEVQLEKKQFTIKATGIGSALNKKPIRKRPSKRKSNDTKYRKNARDGKDGNLPPKSRQPSKHGVLRQKMQKNSALNARLRQLRRRVSRQVIKTVPRRRPRAGGLIWPGDYYRLEKTESPKLFLQNKETNLQTEYPTSSIKEQNNKQKITLSSRAALRSKIEKKAILLDLYVQPRKYLLENHNIKVLKKKLEKAQRPNKIAKLALQKNWN
uniref:Hypothetical chloroplast RF1 n=1 Tax=Chloromonas radiata TaxID=47907 RepID=A0A0S2ICC1_9CHLO|nr:hypothetical chloroplast RF1 [Chloromonas radiata]